MEDRQIVDLYLKRDECAVSETKSKYSSYILAIALNVLDSKPDAEECENDTYLKTWNAIPPKEPDSLKLFLGRIAKCLSIDMYRKNRAQKRGSGMETILSELSECGEYDIPDTNASPADSVDVAELTKIINAFLRALPKEKRVMFVKRYWYAESIDAISMDMGITTDKITTTLFRVRQGLKEELKKEGIAI